VKKWKRKDALEFAFDKNRPLGQWRNVVEVLYKALSTQLSKSCYGYGGHMS